MVRIAGILVIAVMLMAPQASVLAGPGLAVVHIERVMKASGHWQKIVAELEKERTAQQAVLEARQKTLKEKKEQLDVQKSVSDPASLLPKEQALYAELEKLTQEFMVMQKTLTAREKKITDVMFRRVEEVVHALSLKGGYSFVFDAGTDAAPNVLYHHKSIDITDEVIAKYKVKFKDKPLKMK